MRVKWSNVMVFGLLLFTAFLAVRYHADLAAAVSSVGRIGPQYHPQDRTYGLLILGLVLVSLVAVVRLLVDRDQKK